MKNEFKEPFNIVYVNCHKAAIQLGFKIFKEDLIDGVITFTIKDSIWSFGENFKILISKVENSTIVKVFSEGSVGLQIYDWGKNKKNIERFFEAINEQLGK